MAALYDRQVCCFSRVETSYVTEGPRAWRGHRGLVTVERSGVPRTLLPPPPPPPAPVFYAWPSTEAEEDTPAPLLVDTTQAAQAIANALAPSRHEIRAQLAAEADEDANGACRDAARVRAREVDDEVEWRLEQDRRLDAAALRAVQERNRRDDQCARELRWFEDDARSHVDSFDGRGSRERLLIVERETASHRWCANCREEGHYAHDCRSVVVVNVAGDSERSYRPRGGVRHVRGI